jgi:hypothetical protein
VVLIVDHDTLLELADLSFLEGAGYVKVKGNGKVEIGLGAKGEVGKNGKLKLKIKFKAQGGEAELRLKAAFSFRYDDSDGGQETEPVMVDVLVPAVIVVPVVVAPLPRLSVDRIDLRFRTRWEDDGGLVVFGLPLTEPFTRTDGIVVQYFERVRLEYHPTLAGTAYEIQLGLLGEQQLRQEQDD